jgi:hypothetical protein
MFAKALLTVVAACALAFASGCSHVAPYERGKLANPTMSADDLSGPGDAHYRAVLEGAMGGSLAAEGGCGCN